jgi:hypothetical protein
MIAGFDDDQYPRITIGNLGTTAAIPDRRSNAWLQIATSNASALGMRLAS